MLYNVINMAIFEKFRNRAVSAVTAATLAAVALTGCSSHQEQVARYNDERPFEADTYTVDLHTTGSNNGSDAIYRALLYCLGVTQEQYDANIINDPSRQEKFNMLSDKIQKDLANTPYKDSATLPEYSTYGFTIQTASLKDPNEKFTFVPSLDNTFSVDRLSRRPDEYQTEEAKANEGIFKVNPDGSLESVACNFPEK